MIWTSCAGALCNNALQQRHIDVLLSFPPTAQIALSHPWQEPALKIYGNWLRFLAEGRSNGNKDCWVEQGADHCRLA